MQLKRIQLYASALRNLIYVLLEACLPVIFVSEFRYIVSVFHDSPLQDSLMHARKRALKPGFGLPRFTTKNFEPFLEPAEICLQVLVL